MSIFKAYDIRGVYKQELDEEMAYKIAKAFAVFTNARHIVVGGDNRLSTPSLKESFIRGLLDSGVDVTDIGTVPTSMIYFACYKLGFEAGAMITASHNPKEFNGIKVCDSEGLAIGLDGGLNDIKNIMEEGKFKNGNGKLVKGEIFEEYENFVKSLMKSEFRGMKIVVDGSNGSAGIVYAKILRALGADVTELFCEPDGNFPNHKIPDPLVEENLNDIKEEVKKKSADIGFALDGDGDRLVIIADNGEKTNTNHIIAMLAERCLEQNKNAKIVYDVLSSQLIEEITRKNNGIPIVSKVGHSNVPRKCKEVGAPFAGEASSHYFFKESNYTDDALIAAIKILDIMVSEKIKLSKLADKYPTYYQVMEKRIPIAPEIKFKFIEDLTEEFRQKQYDISTIDGVKVKFNNGWAVFRASNTESKIVISYESPDFGQFKKIETIVNDIVKTIRENIPVKMIIMDLEKVIIPTWREVFDLPELNLQKSKISEFFDDYNNLRKEMQYGRMTEDEFWESFIRVSGSNVTSEQMKTGVRKVLKPSEEVLEIAKALKQKYMVVVLSNFTKEWADYLVKQYKFAEIFNDMFWSFQNGVKKPSDDAYLQIVKKFKLHPSECLFIDDKERNTDGAKKLGMRTILYSNPENLKKDLAKFGITVGG